MSEVVRIVWLDSATVDGWEDLDVLRELKPLRIVTLGELLVDGDDHVVVLPNRCDEADNGANAIVIPRACILEVDVYELE